MTAADQGRPDPAETERPGCESWCDYVNPRHDGPCVHRDEAMRAALDSARAREAALSAEVAELRAGLRAMARRVGEQRHDAESNYRQLCRVSDGLIETDHEKAAALREVAELRAEVERLRGESVRADAEPPWWEHFRDVMSDIGDSYVRDPEQRAAMIADVIEALADILRNPTAYVDPAPATTNSELTVAAPAGERRDDTEGAQTDD